MLYNLNRDTKKDPKGWDWLDVFPEHREPAVAQTEDQMFAAMMMWASRQPKTTA